MELGAPDEKGRRRPVPVPGSEFVIDADAVIISIGTSPNPLIKATTKGLEVNNHGGIIVNENGLTSREGVYAGGDAVTGAATVISAMGAGKVAAKAIDEYLSNK
jgi:glutamate synthase (NADPH/NADH) small chain